MQKQLGKEKQTKFKMPDIAVIYLSQSSIACII